MRTGKIQYMYIN